jgi:hypothetical protein
MLQMYFQPKKFLSLEPGMDRAKRQEYLIKLYLNIIRIIIGSNSNKNNRAKNIFLSIQYITLHYVAIACMFLIKTFSLFRFDSIGLLYKRKLFVFKQKIVCVIIFFLQK